MNVNLSLFFVTISSSFVEKYHLVLSLTKLGLTPLTSAPSRHIFIQVPQLFSNNVPIIMTSWPTSFSLIYNIISPIIVRKRISSYYFFIGEPFNFLLVQIVSQFVNQIPGMNTEDEPVARTLTCYPHHRKLKLVSPPRT